MPQTDRTGVNAVEAIFINQFDWIFREQFQSDWGTDAHAEVKVDGVPNGRLLAMQIKSGESYFQEEKEDYYIYRGKNRHLNYWQNNSLPVILVLHNPVTQITIWERIDVNRVRHHKKGWSIHVPKGKLLNVDARQELMKGVSDAASERKILLALDLPLIREIAGKEVYFELDNWVNENPNFKTTKIFLGDFVGGQRAELDTPCSARNVSEFMNEIWPWLSFEFLARQDVRSDGSVLSRLKVDVNEIGNAYLTLEKYYAEGRDDEVDDPGYEDEWDDDDDIDAGFRRNMERPD